MFRKLWQWLFRVLPQPTIITETVHQDTTIVSDMSGATMSLSEYTQKVNLNFAKTSESRVKIMRGGDSTLLTDTLRKPWMAYGVTQFPDRDTMIKVRMDYLYKLFKDAGIPILTKELEWELCLKMQKPLIEWNESELLMYVKEHADAQVVAHNYIEQRIREEARIPASLIDPAPRNLRATTSHNVDGFQRRHGDAMASRLTDTSPRITRPKPSQPINYATSTESSAAQHAMMYGVITTPDTMPTQSSGGLYHIIIVHLHVSHRRIALPHQVIVPIHPATAVTRQAIVAIHQVLVVVVEVTNSSIKSRGSVV